MKAEPSEPDRLAIEVVFALPSQQELIALTVESGTTVEEAIRLSGIADRFPAQDLSTCPTGVWGSPVERQHVLKDGDRVEIYRPLLVDPRDARRRLAADGRSMGSVTKDPD